VPRPRNIAALSRQAVRFPRSARDWFWHPGMAQSGIPLQDWQTGSDPSRLRSGICRRGATGATSTTRTIR